MSRKYQPGPATGAHIQREGDVWTLVLIRDLKHPPPLVWEALTEPEHLQAWAPFDADRSLATPGTVRLTTVKAPTPTAADGTVRVADAPRLLEYSWGDGTLRWELEDHAGGTRLKLWHNIDKHFISWGAAGWHVCIDVMDHHLRGEPVGRIVGPDALQLEGWQRLQTEYARQFEGTP
jgi:uncharacterized protein YndB with AHSA1/START domain